MDQEQQQERLRFQDQNIDRLNSQASDIRAQMTRVEDNQRSLQKNPQFRQVQENIESQINHLETDKVTLMKRLNMVLTELEKASYEKSEIASKLREQERQADELKGKLQEVSSLKNVVNRNLQEDLKYEKELNKKLRDELDRYDREKETLLVKLREQEDISNQINRETKNLNINLTRKNDDLRQMEEENELNSLKMRDLTKQYEDLRNREVHSQHQKRRLEDEYSELTHQRNDLVRRMNDLSDKYENYVTTMNRERTEIMATNQNHFKLLAAKLIFQNINDKIFARKKFCMQEIMSSSREMEQLENKLKRFNRTLSKYLTDSRRHYLRTWYRKAMNFTHENYKNINLVEFNVNKKRKTHFFYQWRNHFLQRQAHHERRLSAMDVVRRFTENGQHKKMRAAMNTWKALINKGSLQQDFMFACCGKLKQRTQRQAFLRWYKHMKRQQMQEKYEKMQDLITHQFWKQRVFLAFKQACLESQTETNLNYFKAWRRFCEQARKNKYHAKKEALVDKIFGNRTEKLLKQCFDAIRYDNMNMKFEECRGELEQAIPERQEMQRKRDDLVKVQSTKKKRDLIRDAFKRYNNQMYRALMIWKDACKHHNHTMDRVKMRLINMHRGRLQEAFYKWKKGQDTMVMEEMTTFTEECMNENQNVENTLKAAKEKRKKQAVCSGHTKNNKLERVRNMLNRIMLKKRYLQWVHNTQYIVNVDDGHQLATKIFRKRRMRNAFNKFKNKAGQVKRFEFIACKVQWFNDTRDKKLRDDVLQSWKLWVHQRLMAKKFLNRAQNSIIRSQFNQAFHRWKTACAENRQMIFMDNVEELEARIENTQDEIKNTKERILADQSSKQHLQSKMVKQSQRIMSNFMIRMISNQMAKGFITWKENTQETKDKKRFLKKTLLYWQKNKLAHAFRHWAENHLADKENYLATRLAAKQAEHKEAQRLFDENERFRLNEDQKMAREHADETQLRETLEANYQKALKIHMSKIQNNHYIEKRRNILLVWADFVKREKNAVNVIGAVARRTLRAEVFQRIRMVARERELDTNAEKVCTQFFKIFKRNWCRQAFSKWRLNNYQDSVQQMVTMQQEFEDNKNMAANEIETMQMQKHSRALRHLQRQKMQKANQGLIQMCQILKQLRMNQSVLEENLAYMKQKRAVQKWFKRTQKTIFLRKRDQKAIKDYHNIALRRCWNAMAFDIKQSKKLGKSMCRVMKRMQNMDLSVTFNHWKATTASMREREREQKENGKRTTLQLLNRLIKQRKAMVMHELRNRAFKKAFKEKTMKRVMLHTYYGRMRHFFDKWKHQKNQLALAEEVNTEGDVVLRKNQASRQAKKLRDMLVQNGYSPEQIDAYLQRKSDQQKTNMHKAIVGLFFRNSEFNIVPQVMNHWKAWVQERKRVKHTAKFVINNMRHPLAGYFRRWKYEQADAIKKLKHLDRYELIDKIINDHNQIGSANSRLDRMDQAVDHLNMQRANLFGHFLRGQRLALAAVKNNYHHAMKIAFQRWKKHKTDSQQIELADQLQRTQAMIQDLGNHVNKLENIHKNLLVENEELRQAALDGIEIAKAVQELTKEREQLSVDLQDRAQTVKKLIEDNNQLSMRLSLAQKEAAQLEQLNNQSYYDPPQRD